ncbi:MAG: metal ABC transporter ATP-binding protein [Micromonosporaceae bacterium]
MTTSTRSSTVPPAVLNAQALVVEYGGRPVLRHASLRLTQGEVVAILGANGSGKSTLVRACLGLVPVASGAVELFGTPRQRFREWWRVGYVPQRVGAGSGVPATVAEVVASGRLARRGLLRPARAGDRDAVIRALDAVGLAGRAADAVATLSGGQQQRALIARALAGEPELLILDEPTAGVDAASQEAFAGALSRFTTSAGTVLLVAHELGPLQALVSRAVVLHQGAIVHDGDVPAPAGHHAAPHHDHVHPHASEQPSGMWGR